MTKITILGDGLLGSELKKQNRDWQCLSRKKTSFNIEDVGGSITSTPDIIVNCIAHTDTYGTQKDPHWKANVLFVDRLIDYCNDNNVKLVHISTDYLYANSQRFATEDSTIPTPVNTWYGYTKLIGDGLVQARSNNYLLIRTSFKPNPFPYDQALADLVGNFMYVDQIANLIKRLIEGNASGVFNVGGPTTTMFDLARRTKTNVQPQDDNIPQLMPFDVSMNLSKMNEFLNNIEHTS